MLGLMQDWPLLISSLLDHAARNHRDSRIVNVAADGSRTTTNWPGIAARSAQLAQALTRRGIKQGERLATLAWNSQHHLECYYGVSGMGAVLHTVNPRLFPDQIAYILQDAQDTMIFVDPTLLPLVEGLAPKLPASVRTVVVMGGPGSAPAESKLRGKLELIDQESLIAGESTEFPWPRLDERTASSLCYTSGTTGMPKGVLYSHRSTVLHAMGAVMPDVFCVRGSDVILPVVPMFHVNAWGLPYSCAVAGAGMVLPGPRLDPASLFAAMTEEGVTASAGVPTIWTALLQWLRANPDKRFAQPPRLVVGGTALPVAVNAGFLKEYGIEILHAWGMTEVSPLGATNARKANNADWNQDQFLDYSRKQGGAVFGVEFRVQDTEGKDIPQDDKAFGELQIRGPWVASAYFNRKDDPAFTDDGWFRTGDVVTLDAQRSMEIVDRAKDVIKSGGEWISSITLENVIMGHPAVQEAAAIPMHHPKWDERPLLLVVAKPGTNPTAEEILAYYDGKVAKWWIPDEVEFVESLPHTATGKLWKAELKTTYKDRLPRGQR